MSMCGALGSRSPEWMRCRPTSKRGAASRRPETNWLDVLASIVTSPPRMCPRPRTVNGSDQFPPSSMSTPISRSALIIVPIGRCRAFSSAVRVTSPRDRPASGATNRITVPACPQSTTVSPVSAAAGLTSRSGPNSPSPSTDSIWTPSVRSAVIMRAESSECRGDRRRLGVSARAARISSRLVSDFDPGTVTVACTPATATGADQSSRVAGGCGEYPGAVIGFYPNEPVRP